MVYLVNLDTRIYDSMNKTALAAEMIMPSVSQLPIVARAIPAQRAEEEMVRSRHISVNLKFDAFE